MVGLTVPGCLWITEYCSLQKNLELQQLEGELVNEEELGQLKPRNGSDGDSGVQVTVDENDIFSTESTACNEDAQHHSAVTTPDGENDQAEREIEEPWYTILTWTYQIYYSLAN